MAIGQLVQVKDVQEAGALLVGTMGCRGSASLGWFVLQELVDRQVGMGWVYGRMWQIAQELWGFIGGSFKAARAVLEKGFWLA